MVNVLCLGLGTTVRSAVACTPNTVHPASARTATGGGALVDPNAAANSVPVFPVPDPGKFAAGAMHRKTEFRACFLTVSDRVRLPA